MEVGPLTRAVRACDVPLERLAGHPHLSEREKIAELSRQFEAVLLRQILRDARKTVIRSDLADRSVGADIYDDLITTQLAEAMSKSGSFGLARALARELSRPLERAEGTAGPNPAKAGTTGEH